MKLEWNTHRFALSRGQRHSKSFADIISGTVFRTVVAAESCDFLNTAWIWILNFVDWYGVSLAYRFGSRSTMRPMIAIVWMRFREVQSYCRKMNEKRFERDESERWNQRKSIMASFCFERTFTRRTCVSVWFFSVYFLIVNGHNKSGLNDVTAAQNPSLLTIVSFAKLIQIKPFCSGFTLSAF